MVCLVLLRAVGKLRPRSCVVAGKLGRLRALQQPPRASQRDHFFEAFRFGGGDLAAFCGQVVVAAALVVDRGGGAFAPLDDQAVVQQALDDSVERAGAEFYFAVGAESRRPSRWRSRAGRRRRARGGRGTSRELKEMSGREVLACAGGIHYGVCGCIVPNYSVTRHSVKRIVCRAWCGWRPEPFGA